MWLRYFKFLIVLDFIAVGVNMWIKHAFVYVFSLGLLPAVDNVANGAVAVTCGAWLTGTDTIPGRSCCV